MKKLPATINPATPAPQLPTVINRQSRACAP